MLCEWSRWRYRVQTVWRSLEDVRNETLRLFLIKCTGALISVARKHGRGLYHYLSLIPTPFLSDIPCIAELFNGPSTPKIFDIGCTTDVHRTEWVSMWGYATFTYIGCTSDSKLPLGSVLCIRCASDTRPMCFWCEQPMTQQCILLVIDNRLSVEYRSLGTLH